jgi:signal transduction histidine kinase/ActR/RegA family two-component response regulator
VIHLLLISVEQQIPESLRESLMTPDLRTVVRSSSAEASTALKRDVFDAVLVYADQGQESIKTEIGDLRELTDCYLLVVAPEYSVDNESAAYELGADMYLSEPVTSQTIVRLLDRSRKSASPKASQVPTSTKVRDTNPPFPGSSPSPLHILREFSYVLGFSLDYKAFTQHFILKLRDQVRFSRIGIFLESAAKQSFVAGAENQNLECIASHGLPSDLVDCFQLNRSVGIGRTLAEHPRVLELKHMEGAISEKLYSTIIKEFNVLGCNLAIPLSDRERTIGVAMISGPVSNRDYTEDELELLYLLMEELGVAIRNSRLHQELANHGKLIENVLGSIHSGAIVVGDNLQILYANAAARRFLQIESSSSRPIDFAALPSKLATAVHSAVEKGESAEPFFIPSDDFGGIFKASIFPFAVNGELPLLPQPTMVILDDYTKIEASKQTALDDSREQLIGLIAERFAHEIRNSLVPLSAHAQLFDQRIEDPKFQKSLKKSLLKETDRIKRFSEQMLYLAQASSKNDASIQFMDAVNAAFESAKSHFSGARAQLILAKGSQDGRVEGSSEALSYAMEELFLNALQANPELPEVHVEVHRNNEGILCLRMRDSGDGFTEETIGQVAEPFFTSRNTGVGLGIPVAKKLIREHGGYLSLNIRSIEKNWDLEIQLPELLTNIHHA